MSFFDRIGLILTRQPASSAPKPAPAPRIQMLRPGARWIDVVGESFHEDSFARILGTSSSRGIGADVVCVLIPEPDNPQDPNAVGVWVDGFQVGHLERVEAQYVAPVLRSWIQKNPAISYATQGRIAGAAWDRCGVYLQLDPVDFVAPEPAITPLNVRTGLSSAPAGSVDWFETLSGDRLTRLKQLRQLLATETEPISRHFVFSELEEVLYRVRDDVADALIEYDQVAESHHRELVASRALLIRHYGGMPLLDTYRQAGIRRSLEGDLQGALEWAQRGIAMYGKEALRAGWLDDLYHRLTKTEQRIMAAEKKSQRSKPTEDAPRAAVKKAVPDADPDTPVEILTCQACGNPFERPRTRGRKPLRCPDCVSSTPPKA